MELPNARPTVQAAHRAATSARGALLLLFLGVFGGGCQKSSAAPPAPSCNAQVAELRAWLEALAKDGRVEASGPLAAVDRAAGHSEGSSSTNIILLNEKGEAKKLYSFDSEAATTSDPPRMRELFLAWKRSNEELFAQLHPGKPKGAYVTQVRVSPSTSWRDATVMFDALRGAGLATVTFAFEGKANAAPPAPTDVSRWYVNHPEAETRSLRVMDRPARAFFRCSGVIPYFGATEGDSLDDGARHRIFLEEMPRAVEECQCHLNVEELKAVIWAIDRRYSGDPPFEQELILAPSDAKGSIELAAPPTETWSAMATRVVNAGEQKAPVAFVVTK